MDHIRAWDGYDKGCRITSRDFAAVVKNSDNYYVLVTRDSLANLPYSVEEIYGIHESGKYMQLDRTYNEFYRIYSPERFEDIPPVKSVIVEDSNSGYEFFKTFFAKYDIACKSAGGKSNVFNLVASGTETQMVIADGAAFGSEMQKVKELSDLGNRVVLYLPESFEWLLLLAGLLKDKEIKDILASPEDYIESGDYMDWEQFFTHLLIEKSRGTYLEYVKSVLNKAYLNERETRAVIEKTPIDKIIKKDEE